MAIDPGALAAGIGSSGGVSQNPLQPQPEANPQINNQDDVTVFLKNVTPNDQVIADLRLVFAAQGAMYDHYIRPVSQRQLNNSMGLQVLLAREILVQISREDAIKELAIKSDAMTAYGEGNVQVVEDLMEEIKTGSYESKAAESFKTELDGMQQDSDQLVPDIGR